MSISPIFFLSFFLFFSYNHVTSKTHLCLVCSVLVLIFSTLLILNTFTRNNITATSTTLPCYYYPLPTQPGPGYFPSLRGGRIGYHETTAAKSFRRQIGERKVKLITKRNQPTNQSTHTPQLSPLLSFSKAERTPTNNLFSLSFRLLSIFFGFKKKNTYAASSLSISFTLCLFFFFDFGFYLAC